MKEKSLKTVYIPNPCHENWDKMTIMEKGRFCQNCQKKVYDFTNATIEEVEIIFKRSKGEACGTFYEDQINQAIPGLYIHSKISFQRFKLRALTAMMAFWLKVFFAAEAFSQNISDTIITPNSIEATVGEKEESKGELLIVKGRLINAQTFKGIGYRRIDLEDNKNKTINSTTTDGEGNFFLEIKEADQLKELFLTTQKEKMATHSGTLVRLPVSKKVNVSSKDEVILEVDCFTRKNLFKKKKRIIRTGRYRMD